jgi:hypothetical protein
VRGFVWQHVSRFPLCPHLSPLSDLCGFLSKATRTGLRQGCAQKEELCLPGIPCRHRIVESCWLVFPTAQVIPNSQLSVSPERGQVAAESSAELEVALLLTQPGPISTVLELDLRGGKTVKLPVRCAKLAVRLQGAMKGWRGCPSRAFLARRCALL